MGITLGWIAVENALKADLLEQLRLEVIGDASLEVGQVYALADTPEGWSVVVFGKPPSNMDDTAATGVPVGACLCGFLTETAMFSEVRSYVDGRLLWSVAHGPDTGGKFIVQGEAPAALVDIEVRCHARQNQADDADYFFDGPIDLAAQLTGYRPATAGLEWKVVGPKKRGAANTPPKPLRSLSAAIQSEIMPLVWSLGWQGAFDNPRISDAWHIVRQVGAQRQTLWLDYASGKKTYVTVRFDTVEPSSPSSNRWVMGWARDPPARVPFWKRFTWSQLRSRSRPELDDPIQAVIDKAKTDILAVDAFLHDGEKAPCIFIQWTQEVPRSVKAPS